MIKMILADDEPIITRGIQKIIDWKELGIEIIGVYENGKQALEGIVQYKPDIALLDISMPFMNGVQVLKECHAMKITTKIIFISGFQDFEYAKEAIKYGAVDYLLKPVIREELLNSIEKCMDTHENRWIDNDEEITSRKETDYKKLIEIEDTWYTPVLPEILYKSDENEQVKRLIHFSFLSFLDEYLEEKKLGIVFVKGEDIVLILKGISSEDTKNIVIQMCEKSQIACAHQTFFVIGEPVNSMSGIPDSYKKCKEKRGYLFFSDQMKIPVLTVGEEVYHRKINDLTVNEVKQQLVDAIIALNDEQFQKKFEELSQILQLIADGRKEDVSFYFCGTVGLLEERLLLLLPEYPSKNLQELLENGRSSNCYGELKDFYLSVFNNYFIALKDTFINNDKKDIIKAKEYIESHYKENLTLNILANEIHMNSYYFSSFFKKQAGENFKDYVNKVRLKNAVNLMLSTDLKIYEIASEVGFADGRAFTEIFQRVYNETPLNYKKKILKR